MDRNNVVDGTMKPVDYCVCMECKILECALIVFQ
jgi:hypothetical protein